MTPEKLHQYIQIAAVVIGITTPCILLSGYVYHLGYITAFGLDSNLISRGLGDVITEAWFMGVLLLTFFFKRWWYLAVFFGVMIAIMLSALYLVVYLRSKGKNPFKEEITKENQGRKILGLTLWHWECWWETVEEIGTWTFVPLVVLMIIASITLVPFQRGADDAKKQINKIKAHGCKSSADHRDQAPCVTLTDINVIPDLPIFSGILVTSNHSHVALFNNETLEIFPLTDRVKLSKVR